MSLPSAQPIAVLRPAAVAAAYAAVADGEVVGAAHRPAGLKAPPFLRQIESVAALRAGVGRPAVGAGQAGRQTEPHVAEPVAAAFQQPVEVPAKRYTFATLLWRRATPKELKDVKVVAAAKEAGVVMAGRRFSNAEGNAKATPAAAVP